MYSFEDLSLKHLYLLLLIYHGKPIEKARLLWSFEEEEIKQLRRYLPMLNNVDNRLTLIKVLMVKGLSIDKIVEAMDWKAFESLVGEVFKSYGYKVYRNYRWRRFEYDVLAVKQDLLISIDCKQWDKPLPPSKAREVVNNLVKRTSSLHGDPLFKGKKFLGAIVTMREFRHSFMDGVAIIPITYLQDFIEELTPLYYGGYLKEI